ISQFIELLSKDLLLQDSMIIRFFHVGQISIEVDIMEKEALDRRLRRLKKAKKTGCLEVIDRGQIHFEEKNQDIEIKVENKGDDLALRRQYLRDSVSVKRKQKERLKAIKESEKTQATQTKGQ
ncbi:30961_t:CDS:2, partial [Racocetra persica]